MPVHDKICSDIFQILVEVRIVALYFCLEIHLTYQPGILQVNPKRAQMSDCYFML